MLEEDLRKRVAENLTHYRKLSGLTQGQLAEALNYSDKSVSKWERGEGLPDLVVMMKLAGIYNISLNDLVADKPKKRIPDMRRQKILITLLSVGVVWLVAVTLFVLLPLIFPDFKRAYLFYIYAIPVTAIVVLVFSSVWGNRIVWFASTTVLCWGIILSVYITFIEQNIWTLFLIGIPMQALIIMWFFFRSVFVRVRDRLNKLGEKEEK